MGTVAGLQGDETALGYSSGEGIRLVSSMMKAIDSSVVERYLNTAVAV
jgi:hypothetical protein